MEFKAWLLTSEAITDKSGNRWSVNDITQMLQQEHPEYNSPDVFMAFSAVDKLGVNPRAVPSDPPTPIGGIYAYQSAYAFQHGLWNMPFPQNQSKKYLFVFKPGGRNVDISDQNNMQYLEQYASSKGLNLQQEIAKMSGVAADKAAHSQWNASNSAAWQKQGYRPDEVPQTPNYFQVYPDQKPSAIPMKTFSNYGPAPERGYLQSELPAAKELDQFMGGARTFDHQKHQRPQDLFWLLPFMWSQGNLTRWGQIYREMGIDGIIDNGNHRIHPSQPYQALFLNPTKLQVIDQYDLTAIGRNSETKGKTRNYGPSQYDEPEYKGRAVAKMIGQINGLLDQYDNNFSPGWQKSIDPEDILVTMDKWERSLDALTNKAQSLTNNNQIEVSKESLDKLMSYDTSKLQEPVKGKIESFRNLLQNAIQNGTITSRDDYWMPRKV